MGEWSKKEAILRSKQLDVIYSKLGMLYKILPNSPQVEIDPMKEMHIPHVDGVIGSIVGQVTNYLGQVSLQQKTNASQTQTNHPNAEVLTTHTTEPSQQPRGKKKGRNTMKTIGDNTSTNNNSNHIPNKKWDKSKI